MVAQFNSNAVLDRSDVKGSRKVVVPFHSSATLHPKIVEHVLEAIDDASLEQG